MTSPCRIRAFAPADAEAVARIYGHYVLTCLAECKGIIHATMNLNFNLT